MFIVFKKVKMKKKKKKPHYHFMHAEVLYGVWGWVFSIDC
jgi:hypothetical protein